jgi:putative methyltransferase (TIGR04325 family)
LNRDDTPASRVNDPDFHVWEGVYSSFAEAGGDQGVFNDAKWLERSEERALALRDHYAGGASPLMQDYCLPVLAAMCNAERGRVRILDFGGALGFSFFPVRACLPAGAELSFDIVEQPAVVRLGRELFAAEASLSFHESTYDVEGPYDIVHSGSALQYAEDWRGALRGLCAFEAPYLVLDDTLAGDIETYVSLQNYYDRRIPCWLWNLEEFVSELRSHAYELIYCAHYIARILDRAGPLPMNSLPKERRLQHTVNLILRR